MLRSSSEPSTSSKPPKRMRQPLPSRCATPPYTALFACTDGLHNQSGIAFDPNASAFAPQSHLDPHAEEAEDEQDAGVLVKEQPVRADLFIVLGGMWIGTFLAALVSLDRPGARGGTFPRPNGASLRNLSTDRRSLRLRMVLSSPRSCRPLAPNLASPRASPGSVLPTCSPKPRSSVRASATLSRRRCIDPLAQRCTVGSRTSLVAKSRLCSLPSFSSSGPWHAVCRAPFRCSSPPAPSPALVRAQSFAGKTPADWPSQVAEGSRPCRLSSLPTSSL